MKKKTTLIKKIGLLTFLSVLCIVLGACQRSHEKIETIVAPANNRIVIGGTWKIVKLGEELSQTENLSEELKALEGKNIEFANAYIQAGNYLLKNPSYKTKAVDGQKYALFGQKNPERNYTLNIGTVEVVTIYDGERSFCEVVKLDQDRAVLFLEKLAIYLKKTSDKTSPMREGAVVLNGSSNGVYFGSRQDGTGKTGVLLGLRRSVPNDRTTADFSYRTLWIPSENKVLGKIREQKDLFFPRRDGFWKMWVQDNEIFSAAMNATSELKRTKGFQTETGVVKWIDFLCNDFISVQYQETVAGALPKRRIVPIDQLPDTGGISASELLGDSGIEALQEGLAKAMLQHGVVSGTTQVDGENFWNFGMERKTGHWFFKGRFFYGAGAGNFSADYPINVIPPSYFLFYDEAKVTWTDVKDNVPEAVDAFTSPNGDIGLIFTQKNLFIYGISKGKLDLQPLQRIPLNEGEIPIMAEWATGRYVNSWGAAFDKSSLSR